MKIMYPGSFDPITLGHIDLIERCAKMFDEVEIAILENDSKSATFSVEERLEMIRESISKWSNVRVSAGSGLAVEYAKQINCSVLLRGIRAVMDYEYELQVATANRVLDKDVETLFLVASPKYSYVSSSLARTIARYGGDLKEFVPDHVAVKLREKFSK